MMMHAAGLRGKKFPKRCSQDVLESERLTEDGGSRPAAGGAGLLGRAQP